MTHRNEYNLSEYLIRHVKVKQRRIQHMSRTFISWKLCIWCGYNRDRKRTL